MSDPIADIAGAKMLQLRQDLVELRIRLKECEEENIRKKVKMEIMEKETYYNILLDRQKLSR